MKKLLLVLGIMLGALCTFAQKTVTWTFTAATYSDANGKCTGSLTSSNTSGTWSYEVSTTSHQNDKTNGPRFGSNNDPIEKGDWFKLTGFALPTGNVITEVSLKIKGNAKASTSTWHLEGTKSESDISFTNGTDSETKKWENLNISDANLILTIVSATGGSYISAISVTYKEDESTPEPAVGAIDYKPVFDDLNLEVDAEAEIVVKSDNAGERVAPAITYSVKGGGDDIIGIDENTILAFAEGKAVVTASWDAVEDVWNAGSTDFNVTVIKPFGYPKYYKAVTSDDEITAGDMYVIAYDNLAISATPSKAGNNLMPVEVNISEAGILTLGTDKPVVFTIDEASDGTNTYLLWRDASTSGSDAKYLISSASSNYLKLESGSTVSNLHQTSATINDKGNAIITFLNCGKRTLQFNNGSNAEFFGGYTSSQKKVNLYKAFELVQEDYTPLFDEPFSVEVGDVLAFSPEMDNSIPGIKPAPELKIVIEEDDEYLAADGTAMAVGETMVTVSWDEVPGMWNAGKEIVIIYVTARVFKPEFTAMKLTVGEEKEIAFTYNSLPGVEAPSVTYSVPQESANLISLYQPGSDAAVVKALKIGTAKVTATWGDAIWGAGTAEFEVNVAGIEANLKWSAAKVSMILGDELAAPRLEVSPAEYAARVEFATSNADVATVSETGGISVVGAGQADITAKLPADEFVCEPAVLHISVMDPEKPEANFDFNVKNPYGLTSKTGGSQDSDSPTLEENGIAMHIEGNYQSHNEGNDTYTLRLYKNCVATFTAPPGYEFKTIEFTHATSNSGTISTVTSGEMSSNYNWSITEPDWCEEVSFTMGSALWLTGVNVTLNALPEADQPLVLLNDDATEARFVALHPSHKLFWRRSPYVEPSEAMAAPRRAEQADEWTAVDSHEFSHTIDDRTAEDFQPYVLEVKAVDRRGNQSGYSSLTVSRDNIITGLNEILCDSSAGEVEYYNLQGLRLGARPASGFYIERRGTSVTKRIAQ